jgi:hypothetical protein
VVYQLQIEFEKRCEAVIVQRLEEEAKALSVNKLFSPRDKMDALLNFDLNEMTKTIQLSSPTVWAAVKACAVDERHEEINVKKTYGDRAVTTIIAQCLKYRSNKANVLQYLVGCANVGQGTRRQVIFEIGKML